MSNPDPVAPGHLFVFGAGYTALALARRVLALGWTVTGTTRSAEKASVLTAAGLSAVLFDSAGPMEEQGAAALSAATHVLSTIPPERTGELAGSDPVLALHGHDLAEADGLRWIGYLSTTGVYGDTGGAWVDEDSPLAPGSERSRSRLAAERDWLGLWRSRSLPVHIFRLPGIYGPGRSAVDALRSGTARRIDKPGQVFSRAHVEDIAQVLQASLTHPSPGRVYNVADDEPAPAHEVVAFAAQLLHMEPPPLEPYDPSRLSPMAASFYAETRRVRNERIKRELGVVLMYPTYREGLTAQVEEERQTAPPPPA